MRLRGFEIGLMISIFLLLISCTTEVTETPENGKLGFGNNPGIPVIVQIKPSCDYQEVLSEYEIVEIIPNGKIMLVKMYTSFEKIQTLNQDPCVVRTFKPSELDTVLEELQGEFDSERDEKFRELKLSRGLEKKDVTDRDDLIKYLQDKRQDEARELTGGVISEYQLYVTPEADAVIELATELGSDIQTIYDEALSWIWVSEEYLNGVVEYWYYPEEFLTETQSLENNPSPGTIASDCSEQANTLVSLLIASGHDTEDVRVVLGLVDFGGTVGGHAWAEIYEDGRWYALEATAGAYFDEDSGVLTESTSISYTYFKHHTYPVEEVWMYYNNKYFKEIGGSNNAPEHWIQQSRSYLRDDLENFQGRSGQARINTKN